MLEKVFDKWNEIFDKPCFKEQTDNKNKLTADIEEYKEKSLTKTGAVLFTYFGGKFSEGYNFKNKYCRCVIMVGVPFINTHDVTYLMKKCYYKHYKQ